MIANTYNKYYDTTYSNVVHTGSSTASTTYSTPFYYSTTTNGLNVTYTWNINDAYSNELRIYFTDDVDGLANYIFSECLYDLFKDILVSISKQYDNEQDFEDNLYRISLDILIDEINKVNYFPNVFDEEYYPYRKFNKIIQNMIDGYHRAIMEEEYGTA